MPSIGTFEREMRDYVYPFMRMTMDRMIGSSAAGPSPTATARPLGRTTMRRLHHVGYWVEDLDSALTDWDQGLDVGPFQVIKHVPFDSFVLSVGDQRYHDAVFDDPAASLPRDRSWWNSTRSMRSTTGWPPPTASPRAG